MALRLSVKALRTEAASGAALALAATLGFGLANSPWAGGYFAWLGAPFTLQMGGFVETLSVRDWIQSGLMMVFFFVVGLEIKQEALKGELSSPRKFALPLASALGGMAISAVTYLLLNRGGAGQVGWPVPTGGDLALALAALAVVGRGLPESLRLYLIALAVAGDIGAVGLIAAVFTLHVHVRALIGAGATLAALIVLSEWKEPPFFLRIAGFLALAAFTLKSGVSTAVAGAAAALTVPIGPARPGQETVLRHFQKSLRPYVAFGVLPVFAFTVAGVSLARISPGELFAPAPIGAALGLILGKPLGIMAGAWIAVRGGLARRPTGTSWLELFGVALLCGIGFTMSLYMGRLAFPAPGPVQYPLSLAVILGSLVAAIAGMGVLAFAAARRRQARA